MEEIKYIAQCDRYEERDLRESGDLREKWVRDLRSGRQLFFGKRIIGFRRGKRILKLLHNFP